MSVEADKSVAARFFGVLGGALLGGGAAAAQFAWRLPPEGRGAGIFFLLVGGIAILLGLVASYLSTSLLTSARIEHVLQWILVPTILVFGASWWLLGFL